MTTRNKKHLNKKVSGSRVEKTLLPSQWSWNGEIREDNYWNSLDEIIMRKWRIEELQDLIYGNIYHARCLSQNIESVCGKGYEEDTDEAIIKAFDIAEVHEAFTEYEFYGEAWIVCKYYKNECVNVKSIPSQNSHIGKKGKYKDKLVQNYRKKTEIMYPILTDEMFMKKIPNGVYAYQLKYGRKNYGFPIWLPAMELIKIMKYSLEDISAFYENDCLPYSLLIGNGLGSTTQDGRDMVDFLEANFQGSKEKRKVGVINIPQPKEVGDVRVLELQKKIADGDFLSFMKDNKTDICVMNGVPSWILDITTAGKLGNTQEKEISLGFYMSEVIEPKRRVLYDAYKRLFPNKQVNFKNIEFPVIETQEPDFGMMESAKSQIRNSIKDVLSEYEINSMRPNK